ncbi:MAG TPA: hypothetical protein ENF92_03045, partial [Desulfobacteraceae bacterium]|nr:hypothetical protein [Desulfobacteraceae bacterium]
AKKYHPDKAGPEAKDQFQDLQEAYEVLSNPDKRSSYDRMLRDKERGIHFGRKAPIYDSSPWYRANFRRPFSRRYGPSRAHADLILILSQEEAQEGRSVEVDIPYYGPCPHCGGSGEVWFFPCMACFGEGLVRERRRVRLDIPAGIEDGSVVEIPIQTIGSIKRLITILIEVR